MDSSDRRPRRLILGIGNVLLGDEGVGVHVVRHLLTRPLPEDVRCLDGGTGGMQLLGELEGMEKIVLVDATVDGQPPGTVRRLQPRFSSDYPPTLTAHDIGLKDMLEAMYLLGEVPDVTLYAVSIAPVGELQTELSPALANVPERVADMILAEMAGAPAR